MTKKKSDDRLKLIRKIHSAKDEGRFMPLTDDDIEDEISFFHAQVGKDSDDEFHDLFLDQVFEGGQ
jgi:hypothetical protein